MKNEPAKTKASIPAETPVQVHALFCGASDQETNARLHVRPEPASQDKDKQISLDAVRAIM
jgi:hypothetical protein